MYETFDHTADIGLRINAGSLDEMLTEAARGLISLVCENPDSIRPLISETFTIHVNTTDASYDDLLFDFLAEVLYQFDAKEFLPATFEFEFVDDTMIVTMQGETVDRSRHRLDMDVKAITYHGLFVTHDETGWSAEVIVDI